MGSLPTRADLWLARKLAGLLTRHPGFDVAVQDAIKHNILGGIWFGAALFLCWMLATREGRRDVRLRMLTMLIASVLAIILTALAGAIISWPPPARQPGLANLFPDYLEANTNSNCFPSQSTAAYSIVAAGIYSLHKTSGWSLWIMVAVAVALPRMYVGGHYMSDILAGLVIALAAYAGTRRVIEPALIARIEPLLGQRRWLQLAADLLIFIWILQVSVEFRDAIWLKAVFESMLH